MTDKNPWNAFPVVTDKPAADAWEAFPSAQPASAPPPEFAIPPAPTGAIIHGADGVSRVAGRPELSTTRTGDARTDTGRAEILAQRAAGNDMGAFRRSLMPLFQGMTFGWGDEAVANLKALTGGSYHDKHEMMRQELERQRAEHPVGSAASQFSGSVLSAIGSRGLGLTLMKPGMGLAKMAGAGAAEGAAYGALYGAGEADGGIGNRLAAGLDTGIVGAGVGAAFPVVGAAARGA